MNPKRETTHVKAEAEEDEEEQPQCDEEHEEARDEVTRLDTIALVPHPLFHSVRLCAWTHAH